MVQESEVASYIDGSGGIHPWKILKIRHTGDYFPHLRSYRKTKLAFKLMGYCLYELSLSAGYNRGHNKIATNLDAGLALDENSTISQKIRNCASEICRYPQNVCRTI